MQIIFFFSKKDIFYCRQEDYATLLASHLESDFNEE